MTPPSLAENDRVRFLYSDSTAPEGATGTVYDIGSNAKGRTVIYVELDIPLDSPFGELLVLGVEPEELEKINE